MAALPSRTAQHGPCLNHRPPPLLPGPFHTALGPPVAFPIAACLVAAIASLLRGGKYHHTETGHSAEAAPVLAALEEVA